VRYKPSLIALALISLSSCVSVRIMTDDTDEQNPEIKKEIKEKDGVD